MKAAWYEKNGPAREVLRLGEIQTPEPAAGEVLVRLATSGVNPSDVKSRAGRPLIAPRIVPHSDGAGVIEAVGPGVQESRVGQRVWIWNGQWQRPLGTAAEAIVLPDAQAVALPEGTNFEAGACLGIPGLTALQAVALCGDLAGKTVLVVAAASAVGYYATQMVARRGARVIGTVGSEEKAKLAREAGAEHTILYKEEGTAARIAELTQGQGVDAVIDMGFSTTVELVPQNAIKPHGVFVCYGSNDMGALAVPFRDLLFRSIALRFFLVYDLTSENRRARLAELNALLEQGALRHMIGARYPLEEIAEAHEAVESGRVTGNVVLTL